MARLTETQIINDVLVTDEKKLRKNIEKQIRKFITDNKGNKNDAEYEYELTNECRMYMWYHLFRKETNVRITIWRDGWVEGINMSVKQDSDIRHASFAVTYIVTKVKTQEEANALNSLAILNMYP